MRVRFSGPFVAAACAGLLSLALMPAARSSESGEAHPMAMPVNGLRLSISLVRSTGATLRWPEFSVAFENVGDQDIVLNLGTMLANGRHQLPERVRLSLTDGAARTRELQFTDREHGGIAGRVDDYLVPLRARSTYLLRLSLDDYWCPASQEFPLKLSRGRYRIVAQFEGSEARTANEDMGGVKFMPFWKGSLQSNVLAFER